jgi:hypothetical protein
MGQLVRYLSRISSGYNFYIVVFVDNFGNAAERIIFDKFEQIARDIGEYANISKLIDERGIREAEERFGLNRYDHKYPVLIITDKHPNDWKVGDKAVRVQLGNYGDENEIRNFLAKLSTAVSKGELDRLKWDLRKKKLKEIAGKIPVVEIITAIVGGVKSS